MSPLTRPQLLLACVLAGACALAPAAAQSGQQNRATDPDAAVPATRYQPAHVSSAPTPQKAVTVTPDRLWHEHNRIVAGQSAHGAHAGHAGHAGHAKPAPDPHAHHGAPAQPEHKEHH
ncbi:hypothetical protein RCH14_003423 [Massilia sp. MP_M2]|uniref:hypothetical protein n=1 Tax=Massilia sp. MP_M2 TaxID=3071713 RepID=UPI00319E4FF8